MNIKIFNNDTHPNIGYVYGNIGLVYDSMKKYQKAYEYTKIATEIFESHFSESHPDLIGVKNVLKIIQGKLDKNNFISVSSKVGRSNRCPCNSGKKYKKCCEKNS